MAKCLLICLVVCVVYFPSTFAFIKDRIIGGRPANNNEFPYQVSLRYSFNDEHFCVGSLIDHYDILTAAHCMFYESGRMLTPDIVKAVAGQNDLKLTKNSIWRNAFKIIVHRAYSSRTLYNDIAIIEFENCFPNNTEKIAIAALNTKTPLDGTNCIVSGWGYTKPRTSKEDQKLSDELLAAVLSIRNKKACQNIYSSKNFRLSPGMICAGTSDGSRNTYKGDSGGPLFCNHKLTGIVSGGIYIPDIVYQYPAFYTDISQYLPWIQNNRSIDTQVFTFFTFFILFYTVILHCR